MGNMHGRLSDVTYSPCRPRSIGDLCPLVRQTVPLCQFAKHMLLSVDRLANGKFRSSEAARGERERGREVVI